MWVEAIDRCERRGGFAATEVCAGDCVEKNETAASTGVETAAWLDAQSGFMPRWVALLGLFNPRLIRQVGCRPC